MEGWHRVFNKKFSKRNLNLSHFIVRLKEEEETTWQLATRNAIHPADPLRGARSAKVENSERQIFKLVQDYSNANVLLRQPLQFLYRIQYHMAKFYIPVADEQHAAENEENRSEEDDNEVELVAPMDANFIFDANLNLFRRI